MKNEVKELTLTIRLILFFIGFFLFLFTSLVVKEMIFKIAFNNDYAPLFITIGISCILFWLMFVRRIVKIPIGNVGVPLILNSIYKGFLFPAGHTWLPFFKYIPIDKKRQFKDLDFENIMTGDFITHKISVNVEYNISDPFNYLDNNETEIFNKIRAGVEENIRAFSTDKGIDNDILIKDNGNLKKIILEEVESYTEKYGLTISDVQIKSIRPTEQIVNHKESLIIKKYAELLNIELNTIGTQKKIEVLNLLAIKYNIPFKDIAKYNLIDNDKIKISEVLKTYNININEELISTILNLLKK